MQAKLIAFLDDASRVVCHGEFFAADTTEALLACFASVAGGCALCGAARVGPSLPRGPQRSPRQRW